MKNELLRSVRTALITLLCAIAFGFIIPNAINPLTTKNCQPDNRYAELTTCESQRPWLQFIQGLSFILGYISSPVLLGMFFGLRYVVRAAEQFWRLLVAYALSVTILVAGLIVFEITYLQPWDSEPYNRFNLDALYGVPIFASGFWFIGILIFLITCSFSPHLWKKFVPLGFLKSKKQPQSSGPIS